MSKCVLPFWPDLMKIHCWWKCQVNHFIVEPMWFFFGQNYLYAIYAGDQPHCQAGGLSGGGVTLLSRDHWTSLVSPLLAFSLRPHMFSTRPWPASQAVASVQPYLSCLWVCWYLLHKALSLGVASSYWPGTCWPGAQIWWSPTTGTGRVLIPGEDGPITVIFRTGKLASQRVKYCLVSWYGENWVLWGGELGWAHF